jgi:hypothetical protein
LLPPELMELATAPFEAILTGSRFFGGATIASDYDFFTAHTGATKVWLLKNGWKLIIDESYCDQNTDAVYRRGCVDVALVKNLPKRSMVQNFLKVHFPYLMQMPKNERKQVWKYSYALLGV